REPLILVCPDVLPRAYRQLPGSFLEGNVLTGQRSLQSTSMVMGIRDYRAGDAMNRIHWPSSVRHRGLFVKEFELDKTADLWIYLDLERHWHRGEGETSTEERAVTVAGPRVGPSGEHAPRSVHLDPGGAHRIEGHRRARPRATAGPPRRARHRRRADRAPAAGHEHRRAVPRGAQCDRLSSSSSR